MTQMAAIAFTVVSALLAIFQLSLILGAPLGRFAWGGQNDVLPSRLRRGSIIAIILYAAFSVIELTKSAVITVAVLQPVVGLLAWMLVVYLVIGVVMNLLSRSLSERLVMTPVAAILVILGLLVAVG